MNQSPPILISTFKERIALAQWTAQRIEQLWPQHPAIYFCGVEGVKGGLALRNPPKDWMKVMMSACADLLSQGNEQIYLILDDHPPIAACHNIHLRETLPAMMRELEATSIVTGGYGPLNPRKGHVKHWRHFRPERLPLSEPWKLPLHPALWNLQRLHDILESLIGRLPEVDHTAWAFERIGSDVLKGGISAEWLSSCWRVNSWETSTREARDLHDIRDRLLRIVVRLCTIAAFVTGGVAARNSFRNALSGLLHPRIGPYPVFWSGVIKKGSLNADYLFYCRLKKRPDLMAGLVEAFGNSIGHM